MQASQPDPHKSIPRLGDPEMDADHCRFGDLIEELAQASPPEALARLQRLSDFAAGHFRVEDEELRQMSDGNASCHLDEHAAVLKSLGEVAEVLTNDPLRAEDLIPGLVREFRRWLPEHVSQMDAAVAITRTKKRHGGAPIVIMRRG